MAIEEPNGAVGSLLSPMGAVVGVLLGPPPTCTFRYHLRPPLYPPFSSSTIRSASIETLVICTMSPERAAGPLSFGNLGPLGLVEGAVASKSRDLRDARKQHLGGAVLRGEAARQLQAFFQCQLVGRLARRQQTHEGNEGRRRFAYCNTFRRWVREGRGLPAHWNPPQVQKQRDKREGRQNAGLRAVVPSAP